MLCHLAGLALVPPRAPTLAPRRGWQRSAVASSVRPPPLPDDRPGLPPPTEEGGVLAQILPISLLLESQEADRAGDLAVGEDAGAFAWRNERWGQVIEDGGEVGRDWLTFFAAVGTIMSALVVLWIYSPTGYGDDFLAALEAACGGNSHLVTLAFGILFPLVHSGLAGLRPYASRVTGERLWRVLFASCSLPLAYSWIVYFISHAHDGVVWWNGEASPVAHAVAWCASFSSFFLLYPSVFNLKEVAAVEKPRLHLWETGVIRITRHPQMVGQLLWSAAHLSMVGSSFTALTMALLVGHHLFAVWHGDRRLEAEHGDAFRAVKERTSVWPFLAILDGRQTLPPDYYKELVRAPYVLIAAGTLAAYKAHPYMQAGAALVRNTGLVPGGVLDGLLGE